MNGMKPLSRCIALAFGGSLVVIASTSVYAQDAAQKQERIEVTGSNIKRIDSETVAPVTVITREQIERSGKATIADVLRDIPANQGNSFNETFTNSFSPGASGISLRGLGQKATLVLINGRRMANYGFAQNLQDSYVDINSIPTAAVERIEILKDGASAIYGADAVAGVVNVILRKDYKGATLGGSGATTSEGGMNEYRANLSAGIGDLATDKFNVFGIVDFYHRDLLTWSERQATKDADFRGQAGGALGWSASGGTYRSNIAGLNRVAMSPCPNTSDSTLPADLFVGGQTGTVCAYNVAPYLTLFPKTDRLGFLGRGTFQINSDLSAFAELSVSHNKTEQTFTPAFVRGTVLTASGGVSTLPLRLTTANPANQNVINPNTGATIAPAVREINYAFREFGGRDAVITSDSGRLLLGLKGTVGTWDYETAVGAAKSNTSQLNKNRLLAGISSDAAVLSGYNFQQPDPSSALIAPYKADLTRKANSELQFIDAKANTELFQLPAGAVGFATGIEHRREKLNDIPDPISAQTVTAVTGNGIQSVYQVVGQGGTATNGNRSNTALFGEFSIPILKTLESQIAVRYDKYSDFGSAVSPKIGFKWTPVTQLAIRANYGKGFRAPTLPEVSPSTATFFTTIFDPNVNVQNFVTIPGIFKNNPDLKPERSTSKTLGIVVEPNKDVSFGIGWYEIEIKDLIVGNLQNAVNRNDAGDPAYANSVVRDPTTGLIIFAQDKYRNVSSNKVRGVDFDFKVVLVPNGERGKWTLRGEVDYLDKFFVKADPDTETISVAGLNGSDTTNSLPRARFNTSLDWDMGAWKSTLGYRFVSSLIQNSAGTPNVAGGKPAPAQVGGYEQFDLFVAYEGIKDLKLSASVQNVLNRRPPYDPAYGSGVDFSLYDLRGRTYTLGATYTFK
jgi:iron complex outermembrane recepter protein